MNDRSVTLQPSASRVASEAAILDRYAVTAPPIGSDHQSDRDHEALRVPELRSAALFREYEVRKLWPAAGLSAEAGSRHCTGSSRWRLERARGAGGALSLLRQRRARCLQLACACGRQRDFLCGLPP